MSAVCETTEACVVPPEDVGAIDEPAFVQRTLGEDIGTNPWDLKAGDFNDDGRTDLVLSTSPESGGQGEIVVLLAQPTGFVVHVRFAVGASVRALAVGDVNRDGHLDLVVGNSADHIVSVFPGLGNGLFDDPLPFEVDGEIAGLAVVQHLDGDEIPDLAVSVVMGASPGHLAVFRGRGDATFAEATRVTLPKSPGQLSIADTDGDGRLDILTTTNGDNHEDARNGTVQILSGNLATGFAVKSVPVGGTPRTVAVGDYDCNGILDLAVANYFPSTISIHLGTASGTFRAGQLIDMGRFPGESWGNHPFTVVTSDLDRNGVLDLVVTTVENERVTQLEGRGDGTFDVARQISTGSVPFHMVAGEFNRNGFPDVAVANLRSHSLTLLLDLGR